MARFTYIQLLSDVQTFLMYIFAFALRGRSANFVLTYQLSYQSKCQNVSHSDRQQKDRQPLFIIITLGGFIDAVLFSSQTPHEHHLKPCSTTGQGLEENYCRNPYEEESTIWCYTADKTKRLELCDPLDCEEEKRGEVTID